MPELLGGTMTLREWLEAAVELEGELLAAPPLTVGMVDLAAFQLNRGGHLRLVVDLLPLEEPRLRVRVVTRSGGWWLSDSSGRVAPSLDAAVAPA